MTEIEIPRLQKLYKDKGIADLINAFAYQNPLEVPKICLLYTSPSPRDS